MMSLLNFLKRMHDRFSAKAITPEVQPQNTQRDPEQLASADKERLMVDRMTIQDMMQFDGKPYKIDAPLQKFIKPGGHPFAYLELSEYNRAVALDHLEYLNDYIKASSRNNPKLTPKFYIKPEKVAFTEYSPSYGYTRIMCTPLTFTGRVAKYPFSLDFMSRLDVNSYQVLGDIYYGQNGEILKANVNVWSNAKRGIVGWEYVFKTVDGKLQLTDSCPSLEITNTI